VFDGYPGEADYAVLLAVVEKSRGKDNQTGEVWHHRHAGISQLKKK